MRAMTTLLFGLGTIGPALLTATGCGGTDFTATVDLPAAQRQKLTPNLKPGAAIKLPADVPFNVHDKRWSGTPGSNGKADPSADATAQGAAYCKADGSDGGASWAEFQLGHCLDNDSGAAIQAELRMSIDYEHGCEEQGEGAKTVSNYQIVVMIKDTSGKVLQTMPLSAHVSDDGRVSWSGSERTIAEITMQPDFGYYILLAGRAQADSQTGSSSSAEIKVKRFTLEIICKPATASSKPAS
ncbi:MAG: hypothetical protein JXQ73_20780 [Phycisphaerae bacterium]|nr:hypothetical protein [Phycisphaerae bacterium]